MTEQEYRIRKGTCMALRIGATILECSESFTCGFGGARICGMHKPYVKNNKLLKAVLTVGIIGLSVPLVNAINSPIHKAIDAYEEELDIQYEEEKNGSAGEEE